MTISDPTVQAASIVLLGSFNPRLFQPLWLATQDLVSATEADRAEIQLISPALTILNVGPFSLQVLDDRFVAETIHIPYFSPLRDLVVGIFRLLRHTPARALGINRSMHFKPEENLSWRGFDASVQASVPWTEALTEPEMVGLDLRSRRDNSPVEGYVQLHLEPSQREKEGIFIRVNDHYQVAGENSQAGLQSITEIVAAEFTQSLDRSLSLAKRTLEVACFPKG